MARDLPETKACGLCGGTLYLIRIGSKPWQKALNGDGLKGFPLWVHRGPDLEACNGGKPAIKLPSDVHVALLNVFRRIGKLPDFEKPDGVPKLFGEKDE